MSCWTQEECRKTFKIPLERPREVNLKSRFRVRDRERDQVLLRKDSNFDFEI